jgi:uncharacterized OsmC-like protein
MTTTASLKTIIEDTSAAVAADPGAASVTFAAESDLVGVCEVDVRIGDKTVKIDEPQTLGGGGAGPNPVEFALAALGSCQAITYRFWSEKLGLRLDALRVQVRGDLDVRGLFGMQDGIRAGFGTVEIAVHLSGPEPADRYAELRRLVDEHCPVLDIFANSVPVSTTMSLR